MRKLSLVVSTIALSSTILSASSFDSDMNATLNKNTENSNSIVKAFKDGSVEGTVALYGQKVSNKSDRNSAYGNGHLGIAYTTGTFYGFNIKAEAKGNVKLGEDYKHDWKDGAPFENSALLTQAYLQYELDNIISMKAGRYEGEYEWLTDYQQGGVVEILPIPDTVVALGYSNKKAESGIDVSEKFHKPEFGEESVTAKADKGVYFLDIQNRSLENITFNPYAYTMPEFGSFYGMKVSLDTDYFGANVQYAKSYANSKAKYEEDDGTGVMEEIQMEDGHIVHAELIGKIEDFEAALGYARTSKKGGAVQISSFGDNISPFEDGDYFYDPDAKTWYLNLAYSIGGFDLGALYGVTKREDDFKTKEFNLGVDYGITDNLSVGVMWVNVKNKNFDETNYNKYLAAVEYSF